MTPNGRMQESDRTHGCESFHDAHVLSRIHCLLHFTEQKTQLEHQVVQLQMETDTISDYVQLYQQQRAALNRRQQDKEAQMNQLLSDRQVISCDTVTAADGLPSDTVEFFVRDFPKSLEVGASRDRPSHPIDSKVMRDKVHRARYCVTVS